MLLTLHELFFFSYFGLEVLRIGNVFHNWSTPWSGQQDGFRPYKSNFLCVSRVDHSGSVPPGRCILRRRAGESRRLRCWRNEQNVFHGSFYSPIVHWACGSTAQMSELPRGRENLWHVEATSHFFEAMCGVVHVQNQCWALHAHQGLCGILGTTVLHLLKSSFRNRRDDRPKEAGWKKFPNCRPKLACTL